MKNQILVTLKQVSREFKGAEAGMLRLVYSNLPASSVMRSTMFETRWMIER